MTSRPLVTDELPDRLLFRPLARLLVRGVVETPITPNQLTAAGALCGVGAGVAAGLGAQVPCAVLLGIMLTLDCADGQLARLRGGGDGWGRIVDGLGDYATATALHLGLIAWMATAHGWAVASVWGVAAGLSMAWSSQLMDKYKRRYRGDVDDLETIRAERDRARGVKRLLIGAFLPYAIGMNHGPAIPDRALYRERVGPAMALWLWLGPTTHYVLAAVLVVLGRPLLYAQVSAVGLTALTVVTLGLQRWLQSRPSTVVT